MFNEYNELNFGIKQSATEEIVTQPSTLGIGRNARHSSYMQLRLNQDGGRTKNEVDRYLSEECEDLIEGQFFDILKWWSANSAKYRVLSLIARDILAFPVTTVSSESAFSSGGRILDPFRSSLAPKTVERLVCLKN